MTSLDQIQVSGLGGAGLGEPRKPRGTKWVVGGYVGVLLSPIIGFIMGLILLIERRPGHGIAVLALSIALFAVAFSLPHQPVGTAGTARRPQISYPHSPDRLGTCIERHVNSGPDGLLRACNKLLGK